MPKALTEDDIVGRSAGWVSPSSMFTFADCQFRWAGRYVFPFAKKPKTPNLSLGLACDVAANAFNEVKMKTHEPEALPLGEVKEVGVTTLEDLKDGTTWEAESFLEIKDEVPRLLDVIYTGTGEGGGLVHSQPVAVQETIMIPLGEIFIKGIIDVRLDTGVIKDLKTAKRSWSKTDPITKIPPVVYTMHLPGESKFEWDIAVRNKKPKLQHMTRTIPSSAKEGMFRIAAGYRRQMDEIRLDPEKALPTGYGVSNFCSRRYCEYWRECSARFNQPIKP